MDYCRSLPLAECITITNKLTYSIAVAMNILLLSAIKLSFLYISSDHSN